MRKLLFFDVDGTIADRVGKKNVVPQSAKDAIKNLQKNGHLCFINTRVVPCQKLMSILKN